MLYRELKNNNLDTEEQIKELAQKTGETTYQIPDMVKSRLEIIQLLQDPDKMNNDLPPTIDKNTNIQTMSEVFNNTQQYKKLLDQMEREQAPQRDTENYNKTKENYDKRMGIQKEYEKIWLSGLDNFKSDLQKLIDAVDPKNYDNKGKPINKNRFYLNDYKTIFPSSKEPREAVGYLIKHQDKIKLRKNGEKYNLSTKSDKLPRCITEDSEQAIAIFNALFQNPNINNEDLKEILYTPGTYQDIHWNNQSKNTTNTIPAGDGGETGDEGTTTIIDNKNFDNGQININDDTENLGLQKAKHELETLINSISENNIDIDVGDPATAYKRALEEANKTLQNSKLTQANYESAKTALEKKQSTYETAYQTQKETALEELKIVLDGIDIDTVDKSIDSEGKYLQAITTAHNINKKTASLQEIKQTKNELEEAKKAYEEAQQQTEKEKNSDFKLSDDGRTLEAYTGKEPEVIIPKGVTTINENAFKDNKNITKITIETTDQLTLKTKAIQNCNQLTEIIIKSNNIEREDSAICVSELAQTKQTLIIKVPTGTTFTEDGHSTEQPIVNGATIKINN